MPESPRALTRFLRSQGPAAAFVALAELLTRAQDSGAAVFAVDADRRVVFWSEGAEALLGWPAEQVVGEHCLKSNRCPECMEGCGIAAHGRVDRVPLRLLHKSGESLSLRKTAQAFFDAEGKFAGGIELLMPQGPSPVQLPEAQASPPDFHGLISQDPSMQKVFVLVRSVAETDAPVLVRGESGTGKELVARAIHDESVRRDGPFLAVNCGALSPALLESELFGHVKGAFTGAVTDRSGLFQRAHQGTLFLDEVGEMPLELQAKLLRVLQDQLVLPVGGSQGVQVDVRVIGATHRSLRRMVAAGTFREDLMYRLRVVPIFLPALRERRGDIDLLLRHFIQQSNAKGPRQLRRVSPEAMRLLLNHRWPGNVRELINVVQYAAVVDRGPELLATELPPEFTEAVPAATRSQDRAQALEEALRLSGGNIGEAAQRLGVSRATFWRWRKQHGL